MTLTFKIIVFLFALIFTNSIKNDRNSAESKIQTNLQTDRNSAESEIQLNLRTPFLTKSSETQTKPINLLCETRFIEFDKNSKLLASCPPGKTLYWSQADSDFFDYNGRNLARVNCCDQL